MARVVAINWKEDVGRPKVGRPVEHAIRQQLDAGHGILKVTKIIGVGSGTVQRVKREMMPLLTSAPWAERFPR